MERTVIKPASVKSVSNINFSFFFRSRIFLITPHLVVVRAMKSTNQLDMLFLYHMTADKLKRKYDVKLELV